MRLCQPPLSTSVNPVVLLFLIKYSFAKAGIAQGGSPFIILSQAFFVNRGCGVPCPFCGKPQKSRRRRLFCAFGTKRARHAAPLGFSPPIYI